MMMIFPQFLSFNESPQKEGMLKKTNKKHESYQKMKML